MKVGFQSVTTRLGPAETIINNRILSDHLFRKWTLPVLKKKSFKFLKVNIRILILEHKLFISYQLDYLSSVAPSPIFV